MSGTIDNPWTLQVALHNPHDVVLPGDTIVLRGGEYGGAFTSQIQGEPDNRVTIRPYPGESVTIKGAMEFLGQYTDWHDIEFTGIVKERYQTEGGHDSMNMRSEGVRLINCILHDRCGNSIGTWESAPNAELYGCLMLNNGFYGDDRGGQMYDENGERAAEARFGHGHGFYMQNETGTKLVKHCVFLPSFGFTFTAHGTSAAGLNNITVQECVAYSFRSEIGNVGANPEVNNALIDVLIAWETSFGLGQNHLGGSASIRNSLWFNKDAQPFRPAGIESGSVTGNRFVFETTDGVPGSPVNWHRRTEDGEPSWVFDDNDYYTGSDDVIHLESEWWLTLAEFQALGHEASGRHIAALPTGAEVFVWPNEYADEYSPRVGIVAIVDWGSNTSINADLGALGMSSGQEYTFRNAFNPFTESFSHTSDGDDSAVSIALTGWTIAAPEGTADGVAIQEPLEPMPDKLRVFIVEEA